MAAVAQSHLSSAPPQHSNASRLPPQSLEAEQSVLGGLLLDNSHWDKVSDKIRSADFYNKTHRLVFTAIASLAGDGQPADVVTTAAWLAQRSELENIGGLAYLGTLANSTPSTVNVSSYARIVRECSVLRRLITAANDIANKAYFPAGNTPAEILDQAEELVLQISREDGNVEQGFKAIQPLLSEAIDQLEQLFGSPDAITGVATGFTDLDEITSGLQKADLVIVAGRPSMGKTSFAMNVAENAAVDLNLPVAIFSMEMPGKQLAIRLLSSLGRVNSQRMRTGKLGEDDWPRISSAVGLLNEAPVFIDDTPALTALDLRSRARRLVSEQGQLGLIVIDYIQLMQAGEGNENRATEISAMTRSLKALAKELDVPVVVLSQLNRSLEARPNKRPVMSDLRESGAIEQDADVILFIYRDEVYNEDSPQKGTAEIIIAKQRNGPVGTVRLSWLGEFTRFENHTGADFEGQY